MNFRSDNVVPAAPAILEAVVRANAGTALSYGADERTRGLDARFSEIFECEVAVLPVVTGTAANALALATVVPAYGAIFCHEEAHIVLEEAGAPEFYAAGAKLVALAGAHGRIEPDALGRKVALHLAGGVHWAKPAAVSLTQSTEAGTVYAPDAVAALAEIAHAHGLAVHMDGARLSNALAALGVSPAAATWCCGVDVLSFGATKNGALAAEAVVLFRPTRESRERLAYLHKRGGHLLSKMRFVSAQLEAYLADGLWLANARRANRMAARLGEGLAALAGVSLEHPVEANEVFARLPGPAVDALLADGVGLHRWGSADTTLVRLVASYATGEAEVDAFLALARRRVEEVAGRAR